MRRKKFRVEGHFCSFVMDGIPCPHRSQYRLHFEDGHKSNSCYSHLIGVLWCHQYAGQEMPAFFQLELN